MGFEPAIACEWMNEWMNELGSEKSSASGERSSMPYLDPSFCRDDTGRNGKRWNEENTREAVSWGI